jgi:hypothetical protein
VAGDAAVTAVVTGTEHGTDAGYQRHMRRAESPCEECRAARRDYMRDLRVRNPQIQAAHKRYMRARNRALEQLAREHPERFRQLLDEGRARP